MFSRQEALQGLHFTCAATATIYLCATLRNTTQHHPLRSIWYRVLYASSLVALYVLEAVFPATDRGAVWIVEPHVVNCCLLCLAWALTIVRPDLLRNLVRITMLFEFPILSLTALHHAGEAGQPFNLACQITRIAIMASMFQVKDLFLARDGNSSTEKTGLPQPDRLEKSRTADFLAHLPSTDSEDDFEDDDDDMKEFRAKRLQETGGIWGYIKDFSVFLPHLIPYNDAKVLLCILVSFLCLAGQRILNILIPQQLGLATDMLLNGEAPYWELGVWLGLNALNDFPGFAFMLELAKIPIKLFSERQITIPAFDHVMSLSIDFHSERDSAEVMKALEQGESLIDLLDLAVNEILPTVADLIIALGILYYKFNIYAAASLLVALGIFLTAEIVSSKWNTENRRRSTRADREKARVLHQAIQGWMTVSYFNMFSFETWRFGKALDAKLAASTSLTQRDACSQGFLDILNPVTFFAISTGVVYEISTGRASPGDFVFLIQYWDFLIWPLKMLAQQYRWLMADLVDAERLLNLIQAKPVIVDKASAEELRAVKGHVEFKDIDFAYNPKKPTIEGLTVSVEPGQTVALVGATGAGKSSIIKLLLRFYDVTRGVIEIDGYDIRTVTISSLRDVLGVVPQDPLLFNTTIMENLRYARLSATADEIFEACRAAAIHEKILTFPDGYETRVGEHGMKLSGGEIQRLAIARVFLKDPPILILDEATSAVDSHTESNIQGALEAFRTKRTTFIIAHRLSTIVDADQILVMDEGRLVERGTHPDLLKMDGKYRHLWMKQTGRTEPSRDGETASAPASAGGTVG
ncbi:Heavy metal tolerance protein [Fusarium sp. LHS14.1]|nr:Heavy metal tolerance protein [Fusarium sp. LHS14.1]